MNSLIKIPLTILCTIPMVSCNEDDQMDIEEFEVAHAGDLNKYAMSAGTSTIFVNSSKAYDMNAPWVTGKYSSRFLSGDGLYDDVTNNYGPVYAGYSCGSCHMNAGRTSPGVWNYLYTDTNGKKVYGSGTNGMSAMLVYVTRKNGAFFNDYGRVIHDHSIYGVKEEGKLKVTWDYMTYHFPDGEEYELAKPNYTVTDWYTKIWDSVKKDSVTINPEDLMCTVRIPLRHVGMGQMMAIDRNEIEALAAKSNYPEYGISGRCNYITEGGVYGIG